MPTDTTYLFRLIKSMSPVEKRYFKVFSEKHMLAEGNKYIALFDAIDKQDVYDKPLLIKQLSGKGLTASALPNAKNRLYKNILKCLSFYYSETSVEQKIRQQIQHAGVLYKKRLFPEAQRELEKATKMVYDSEAYGFVQQLVDMELDISNGKGKIKHLDDEFATRYEQQLLLGDHYNNILKLKYIGARMYNLFKKISLIRTPSDEIAYQEILQIPLVIQAKASKFIHERIYYHLLHRHYYLARRNDYKNAYRESVASLKLFEEHPFFIESKTTDYIAFLSACLRTAIDSEKYSAYKTHARQLQALRVQDNILKLQVKSLLYMNELYYYYRTGQTAQGLQLIDEMDKGFFATEKDAPLFIRVVCYIFSAFVCFVAGEYRQCLRWCNRALDYEETEVSSVTAFKTIKLLMLLTHYELKNESTLLSSIRSMRNMLKKRKEYYEGEKKLLRLLEKLVKLKGDEKRNNAFLAFRKELIRLSETAYDGAFLEDFHYLVWAESKIQNCLMADILRKRFIEKTAKLT